MSDPRPVDYSRIEIESFLPCGWTLVDEGGWEADDKAFKATVTDGVDFEWPLVIKPAEVAKEGRQEALRLALDRLHRRRLGDPTRGLGVSRATS